MTLFNFERTSLFTNRLALLSSFYPQSLPHRKEKLNEIASFISPALSSAIPPNILIYGAPGTGKTSVIKRIQSELVPYQDIKPIYVPCSRINSHCQILQAIITACGLELKGHTYKALLYEKLLGGLSQSDMRYIIILDDADKITKQHEDVVLSLSRINTELPSPKVALILISNQFDYFMNLDERTQSSLSPRLVLFAPYNAEQLFDILDERSRAALSNTPPVEVLSLCSAVAAKRGGDVRLAIDLLRSAAETAELNNHNAITQEDVRQAIKSIDTASLLQSLASLQINHKLILSAIMECDTPASTPEVYATFCATVERAGFPIISYRRVSELLNQLVDLKLINAPIISDGEGRMREISLTISRDTLNMLLKEFPI